MKKEQKKTKKGTFVSSKKKDILLSLISLIIGGLSLSYFLSSFYSFNLSFKFVILVVFSLLFFSLSFSLLVTHLKLTKDSAKTLFAKDGFLNLLFVPFLSICLKDKIGLYNPNIWFAFLFILVVELVVFLKARFIDWDIVKKRFVIKSHLIPHILLFSLIILYIFIFTLLSFTRHYRLMTSLDLAGFNQALWNTLRGRIFETSLYGHNFLGEHMSPILIFLAPIYALWQDPQILLFLQSLFLGISALSIYLIAYYRSKDRFISLIFACSYLLYPFLSRVNLFDFHEISIAIPLLLFTFLALIKRKFVTYFILAFLSLMVKEDVSLAILGLGIYTFFRIDKRIGIITIIASIFWAFIALKILIPWIQMETSMMETPKIEYQYIGRYEHLGKSLSEIAKTIIFHPISVFKTILFPQKIITILLLFFPFGFLSLASPLLLFPLIPNLLLHLLAYFKVQYLLLWQYSALIIPFVVISSIYGFGNIIERFKKNRFQIAIPLSISIFTISVFSNLYFNKSPFIEGEFDAEEYKIKLHKNILSIPSLSKEEKARIALFYTIKELIPKDASLSCQYAWGAHLSSRKYLYPFVAGRIKFEEADYVLLDKSQRDLNFNLYLEGLKKLEADKRFFLIFEEKKGDGFTIYIRNERKDEFLSSCKRLNSKLSSSNSNFIFASSLYHLGKIDEALLSAEKVVELNPTYYKETPWVIIGDIYLSKREPKKAHIAYKKAIEKNPLLVYKLLNIKEMYVNQGLLKEADLIKKEIEKIIFNLKEKERKNPNIFLKKQLAFIYANTGQYQEAISLLKEILAIEPNDPWAGNLFNEIKNFP